MKQRKIYLRKKGKQYCFETKKNGKTIYLWTIPKDCYKFIIKLCNSSFFTEEKATNIKTLLASADYKNDKQENPNQNVPTRNIVRTSEEDGEEDTNDPDVIMKQVLDAHAKGYNCKLTKQEG